MSVIRDVIIDNDMFNEFSQRIIVGYSQIEKSQKVITTTEPIMTKYELLIYLENNIKIQSFLFYSNSSEI